MAYTVTSGTNVSISEKGRLRQFRQANASTGTGDVTLTHTVPAGKAWILKNVNSNTLTGTASNKYVRVVTADALNSDIITPASTVFMNVNPSQPITLAAGDSLVNVFSMAVSGSIECVILVQEYTV